MIIKASKNEIEFPKEQLLKLIKENKSDLSHASDDEFRAGVATFSERFSVNQALMKRAIEHIRNAVTERMETLAYQEFHFMNTADERLARRKEEARQEEEKMESIGPELLGADMDDQAPF